MLLKELKALLANSDLPDDAPVLLPSDRDYVYSEVKDVRQIKAVENLTPALNKYEEYWGEDTVRDDEQKKVSALYIY